MNTQMITFSDEMIKAVAAGTKSQTRRVIKPQKYMPVSKCPFGAVGDYLFCREEIIAIPRPDGRDKIVGYYSDRQPFIDDDGQYVEWPFSPSWLRPREMPPRFSRFALKILDVRVDRLLNITEDDCKAEGVPGSWPFGDQPEAADGLHYSTNFTSLWNSINSHRGHPWESNPWLWVLTFKTVRL